MKSPEHLVFLFVNYLKGLGYVKETVQSNIYSVNLFIRYLEKMGIKYLADVNEEVIRDFVEHLKNKVSRYGKPYTAETINRRISSLRHFFRFLYRHDYILRNPIENLPEIKEIEKRKDIFTKEEITTFLDSINTNDLLKRSIFELMYSSGLRVSEVSNLNISDVDLADRTLVVKQGKGGKDRFVPFSEIASVFLKRYIERERKRLLPARKYHDEEGLFLTEYGRISPVTIRKYFGEILKNAGITKRNLTVHSIRHTTATHLLEAGADVRYVQELLGHESIETTVKYTHLMMENLKKAYKSSHPRENEYFDEIDEEYIESIKSLKEEIIIRREINKKYRK